MQEKMENLEKDKHTTRWFDLKYTEHEVDSPDSLIE